MKFQFNIMKKFATYFVLMLLVVAQSCKKDDPQLGDPPTAADAQFTYASTTESDNVIEFTASNSDIIAKWDFGNGLKGEGTVGTASYPLAGTYTVTLTVFNSGGSYSNSEEVVIAENDITLLDDPIYNILTGGIDGIGYKTWVVDSAYDGHFGVGPNPSDPGFGDFPNYYEASANEKPGVGFYDTRHTFYLDEFKFDMKTNGLVYLNAGQAGDFPGSYEALGDYAAPYDDQLGETWSVVVEAETLLTVTGGAFLGYYAGTSTYKIVSMEENEIFLRVVDQNDQALAWYLRLVAEGYDSQGTGGGGGGGGGGGTGDSTGYELPIDFETIEPVFEAFGGSSDTIIDNPDPSGINTSARVLETVHGNETWAGIFVDIKGGFDFTTETEIAVMVWAPAAGTFRIKLEDRDNSNIFVEKDVTVTTANAWEEIFIDFSGEPVDAYNRLVLFPGWDMANAGTFYIDNIEQR
jgi:PKD repeat protein